MVLITIFFLAFVLFALAASTDWLDGQIARRTGTVTAIGKAIDPLVDRLLIASGVVGLYVERRLPLWIVLVLLGRDLYLLWGAWRLEQRYHCRLSVTYAGKVTTALLLIGFSDLILNWPMVPGLGLVDTPALPGLGSEPAALGIWFVYAGLALSLSVAVQYTVRARRTIASVRAGRGCPPEGGTGNAS